MPRNGGTKLNEYIIMCNTFSRALGEEVGANKLSNQAVVEGDGLQEVVVEEAAAAVVEGDGLPEVVVEEAAAVVAAAVAGVQEEEEEGNVVVVE